MFRPALACLLKASSVFRKDLTGLSTWVGSTPKSRDDEMIFNVEFQRTSCRVYRTGAWSRRAEASRSLRMERCRRTVVLRMALHFKWLQSKTSLFHSDIIFSVPKVVSFCSQGTILRPGTLILAGTPAGVGHSNNPKQYLQLDDGFSVQILPFIGTLTTHFANDEWLEMISSSNIRTHVLEMVLALSFSLHVMYFTH